MLYDKVNIWRSDLRDGEEFYLEIQIIAAGLSVLKFL